MVRLSDPELERQATDRISSRIETTTASVHDSQIDLSREGEVVYRDKGYFGAPAKGYDATMKRATRSHPLSIRDKLRNKRISRKRAPGERPYAVIKNVFNAAHVRVTTVARVAVTMIFTAFAFDLFQLRTLVRKEVPSRKLSSFIEKNGWK